MTMDEDLFDVPGNDEEMLDANDEDMEDQDNNNSQYDNVNMVDGEEQDEEQDEEEEDEEDEEDENEGNEDEMEEDEDEEDEEEDNEEEEEEENEDEDDEDDDDDENKFVDSSEHIHDPNNPIDESEKVMNGVAISNDKEDNEADKKKQLKADKEDYPNDEPEKENGESLEVRSSLREKIMLKAKEATNLDIVPSLAIPYNSECHTIAFTDGPKWILTGGEDGFIRKYDFIASIQGKSPLTMAQKHNMVDSITKAGVISSYWENEQPLSKKELVVLNPKLKASDFSTGSVNYEPKVNPVYALDVERNGFWCLSGLSSGGISLYTMRHNEGSIHHYFMHQKKNGSGNDGHSNAISVLKLNTSQDKFLSGSWDKTIKEWDLNSGKSIRTFAGSTGQISNIQFRPNGLTDLNLSSTSEEIELGENDENKSDVDSLFGESENDNENEKDQLQKLQEAQDKVPSKISVNKSKAINKTFSNDNIFMSSSMDGTVNIWDVRASNAVLRLGVSEGTPPWCMSATWSNCGEYIYVGRRNSSVEELSIKMPHTKSKSSHNRDTMIPNISKLLQFPKISGPVSAISTMPNADYILCGSNDNIRLYNLKLYKDLSNGSTASTKKPATPFTIIPGHHGGILSSLYVDDTGRFMVSASGNRGWGHSIFTDTVLIYEIDIET